MTISLKPEAKDEKREHKTLRLATLEDIPDLIELARELTRETSYDYLPFNEKKVRQNLERFIIEDDRSFLVLVSYDEQDKPVGVLAAYAFEPLFTADKIAVESLLYLKPEYRKGRRGLDLMDGYEYWARMVGCSACHYGVLLSKDGKPDEKLSRLYQKSGGKVLEHVYYKDLRSTS